MLNFLFRTRLELNEDLVNAIKSSVNVDEIVKESVRVLDFTSTDLDRYITREFGNVLVTKSGSKNVMSQLKKAMSVKQLSLVFPGTDKNLLEKISKGIYNNLNNDYSVMSGAFGTV